MKINISETLKNARKSKGYSLESVQQTLKSEFKIEIDSSNISRYENGKVKTMDAKILRALCKVYGLDYLKIFKELGFVDENINSKLKGNARILSGQEELGTIELPVYGKASAGNGYINFEEVIRIQKITSIPGLNLPKGSFIIEVGGDSMFPTLLDGDLAIVKPVIDCEEADGKICVVTWNDQTFIKRVKYQKGIVILMSDNPDRMKYQDVFIEKDELQYLKCHGIVVESRRKY